MAEQSVRIRGLDELNKKLRRVRRFLENKSIWREIGTYLVASIKDRTSKGKDVDEKDFIPYSPGHLRTRSKKGLPTNTVDLFFTGSMMASMNYDASAEEVRIFFKPGTDKTGSSNPEKAFFLQQDREFFGISDEDVKEVMEIVEQELIRSLRS